MEKKLRIVRWMLALMASVLFGLATASASTPPPPTQTLTGKVITGFQGWFRTGCDGSPYGWTHWFQNGSTTNPPPDLQYVHFDLTPDWSQWQTDSLCATNLTDQSTNATISLPSDIIADSITNQLTWASNHGIQVIADKRNLVALEDPNKKPGFDTVLTDVKNTVVNTGQGFFILYDTAGADSNWASEIESDWQAQLAAGGATTSPNYQYAPDKSGHPHPIVGIAGLGDNCGSTCTWSEAQALLTTLRNESNGNVTILGIVCHGWRTGSNTCDYNDPADWITVDHSYDILVPWTVTSFKTAASFNGTSGYLTTLEGDITDLQQNSPGEVGIPTMWAGFSAYHPYATTTGAPFNYYSRNCGNFYNMQAQGYLGVSGVNALYAPNLDEYDEGTAISKVIPKTVDLPSGGNFLALDLEGCNLGDDYYLKMAGQDANALTSAYPLVWSSEPSAETVVAGSPVSYTINVGEVYGLSGTVSLSVSGLPNGATAGFSTNPISISSGITSSTTLTINTSSNTPNGTYTLTITAANGSLSSMTKVALTVTNGAGADFSISVTPSSRTINQGQGTSFTVSTSATNGYAGTVYLNVSATNKSLNWTTMHFNPGSVTPSTSGSSALSISTCNSTPCVTPTGTYTLTITGMDSTSSPFRMHTAQVTLTVQ